jgi:hypothetical protein
LQQKRLSTRHAAKPVAKALRLTGENQRWTTRNNLFNSVQPVKIRDIPALVELEKLRQLFGCQVI